MLCGVQAGVITDLVLLSCVGIRCVLVHGGGPEINSWLGKVGIEPNFKNGLRVTDGELRMRCMHGCPHGCMRAGVRAWPAALRLPTCMHVGQPCCRGGSPLPPLWYDALRSHT